MSARQERKRQSKEDNFELSYEEAMQISINHRVLRYQIYTITNKFNIEFPDNEKYSIATLFFLRQLKDTDKDEYLLPYLCIESCLPLMLPLYFNKLTLTEMETFFKEVDKRTLDVYLNDSQIEEFNEYMQNFREHFKKDPELMFRAYKKQTPFTNILMKIVKKNK